MVVKILRVQENQYTDTVTSSFTLACGIFIRTPSSWFWDSPFVGVLHIQRTLLGAANGRKALSVLLLFLRLSSVQQSLHLSIADGNFRGTSRIDVEAKEPCVVLPWNSDCVCISMQGKARLSTVLLLRVDVVFPIPFPFEWLAKYDEEVTDGRKDLIDCSVSTGVLRCRSISVYPQLSTCFVRHVQPTCNVIDCHLSIEKMP
ncbi:hypothetical protein F5880DRAFT_248201 [Lentinula raphanica]|nr:hypothetical protein F5880DRAFT_248201 [Lentinula raphanica]